jgi:hypothetical protein
MPAATARLVGNEIKKAAVDDPPPLFYKENHALDAWFNKAYGGGQEFRVPKSKAEANKGMGIEKGKASLVQREVSAEQADGGIVTCG